MLPLKATICVMLKLIYVIIFTYVIADVMAANHR